MYFMRRTRRRNFARRLECTRGRRSAQSADSAVQQQNPRAKRSTRRVETATSTSAAYLSQAIEIEIKMCHWYTLKFSRLNTDLIAQLERLKIEMFLKIWSQMNRLNNNLVSCDLYYFSLSTCHFSQREFDLKPILAKIVRLFRLRVFGLIGAVFYSNISIFTVIMVVNMYNE